MEITDKDIMFKHPFCMTVAGPSKSGKTHFVSNLLQNIEHLVYPLPARILYYYSEWQEKFEHLKTKLNNIEFIHGIDDLDNIDNSLIILDDLMNDCIDNKDIVHLFTAASHHRKASAILFTQNVFEKGKYARSISLNSNYLVIFNNLRDRRQIKHLGSQLYPGETHFIDEVLNDAFKSQERGYLIIDLMPNSKEQIRLRTIDFLNKNIYTYIKIK